MDRDSGEIMPAVPADAIVAIANTAMERVEAMRRLKAAALAITNSNDWVDENGKPYLLVSGAEKIARLFGISWRIEGPIRDEQPDRHYTYTYKGEFSLHGATIEAIGMRSSRDTFFTTRYRDGKRIELSPDEVDATNVKMSAYTNCIGNGITRLLGLRNLTWDDLRLAGITVAAQVSYQQPPQKRGGTKTASEAQMRYIARLLEKIPEGERISRISQILGREVEDLQTITLSDAQTIIEALTKGGQND